MNSVLRSVRKRKKGRTLGAVDVIDRAEYAELEVDAKVELIRSLVPLGLMHIEELLDEEVTALAGERYARKAPSVGGRRHGSNPGTVGLAGQRVPIRVPRIRHVTEREIPLRSYEALHGDRAVNDLLRLSERLQRSLATTNAIESLLSRTRHIKRNVKRWRGGTMVLRWVAAGVLEAAKGFRRVNGCKEMPTLVTALRARDAQLGLGDSPKMVA